MSYPEDIDDVLIQNRLIAQEIDYDKDFLKQEHQSLVPMLNDDHPFAYEAIMTCIHRAQGQVFFLYGYGGTGKTFVWKTLSAAVRSKGDIVLNVASSGIASLLLPGGRTGHSKFAIPLNLNDESTCNISPRTDFPELISEAKLIICDEAPMMHRNFFEALDRTIRDIMRVYNPEAYYMPFGGKVIVFGGDFRQYLPVIPKGTRQDVVHATINSSKNWRDCKVMRLTKNMRLQNINDVNGSIQLREFSDWIAAIGDGTLGKDNDRDAVIEIPQDLLITESDNYIVSMVEEVYPSFSDHIGDVDFLQGRAILAPTLEDVDTVNDYMVLLNSTEERIYLSADFIETTDR